MAVPYLMATSCSCQCGKVIGIAKEQEWQYRVDTSMLPCLLVDTVTITEATQLEITIPHLECVTDCSFLSPYSLHHHPYLPQTDGGAGVAGHIHIHLSVRYTLPLSRTYTAATEQLQPQVISG